MPSAVSEIASGAQFSRSSDGGRIADSQTRVFRIVLSEPGEYVNFQQACGVYVGSPHPTNVGLVCRSFDGRFDGESRMVLLATFNYGPLDAQESQNQPPDVRPANWTVGVATYEAPVNSWRRVLGGVPGAPAAAENPAGDMYDGISKLEPIVTISVTQPQVTDPMVNIDAVGCINVNTITIGTKSMARGTVLLRSIQSSPIVEPWGDTVFRGWSATYEFLYKRNPTYVDQGNGLLLADIGWDVAVPVTGFNVKAVDPAGAPADVEVYGQPLRHGGDEDPPEFKGRILEPLELPLTVDPDDKVRAMVKVFSYENGGASQVPSAQPIALNSDGTPRKDTADPKVLIYRYRVYDEIDFNALGLRLY